MRMGGTWVLFLPRARRSLCNLLGYKLRSRPACFSASQCSRRRSTSAFGQPGAAPASSPAAVVVGCQDSGRAGPWRRAREQLRLDQGGAYIPHRRNRSRAGGRGVGALALGAHGEVVCAWHRSRRRPPAPRLDQARDGGGDEREAYSRWSGGEDAVNLIGYKGSGRGRFFCCGGRSACGEGAFHAGEGLSERGAGAAEIQADVRAARRAENVPSLRPTPCALKWAMGSGSCNAETLSQAR